MSMELLIQALTDHWVICLLCLVVFHRLIALLRIGVLRRRLGAKPFQQTVSDRCYGFLAWYPLLMAKRQGRILDYNQEIWETLPDENIKTFTSRMVGNQIIFTRDPENIKALLATQFNDFNFGYRHELAFPLLGDGIFTLDGEGWKQSRSMLRPQFAREQISHVQALEPHVQILAKHIKSHQGKCFDIQELFFRLTVDSATEFLFGESVECLRDATVGYPPSGDDETGKADFAEAFNETNRFIATRALAQKFYWLVDTKKFRDDCRKVHKFSDYYVNKALKLTPEELEKDSKGGYVFLYELVKHTRDPRVLRDQLLNILLAGRDTTAGILSFLFYELARNPIIFNKLRQEISDSFGVDEDARIEEITFESLKKCEYLKAVINEGLRLYPVVPKNFRVATKNTTLPRGGGKNGNEPILVQKGQSVLYSVYATHRDVQYYGTDAKVFRPERWFEPETRKLGWAYLPFNGGPRICLGQQFALTETSYVITRLLQMFTKLEPFDEEYPPLKASHLTLSLQNGCNISMI